MIKAEVVFDGDNMYVNFCKIEIHSGIFVSKGLFVS